MREHFQNIIALLTNDGGAMQKVLLTMEFHIPLSQEALKSVSSSKIGGLGEASSSSVRLLFDPDALENSGQHPGNSWYLWDVPLMQHLSSGNFESEPTLTDK